MRNNNSINFKSSKERFKMRIDQWIKKVGGATKAARLLDANPRSVHQWKAFQILPHAKVMQKIKRLSRGKCSYNDMIENFLSRQK